MNDSFGGDFNATQTASGSGGGGAHAEQRAEGIAPVLIKQLHDSTETSFSMFGMNFGIVCCVAIVRSIEQSSTKITYLLEDHTGRIEAHYWLEDGDDADRMSPDIMINNYAKVYGSLRSQGGTKTMMIFRLINIKDPNEISTHMLEVMNTRFKAEDYSKQTSAFFGDQHGTSSIGGVQDQKQRAMDTDSASSGLDPKNRAVFEAIRTYENQEQGISRKEIYNRFNKIDRKEMDSMLDFLTSEGHIYSSVDSDHFLSTDP